MPRLMRRNETLRRTGDVQAAGAERRERNGEIEKHTLAIQNFLYYAFSLCRDTPRRVST